MSKKNRALSQTPAQTLAKTLIQAVFLAMAGTGFASCGKSASTSPGPTSVLDGTWKALVSGNSNPCITTNGSPLGATQNVSFVLGGGNYALTTTLYSDSTCTTPSLTSSESGTFVIGSTDAILATATDITLVQSSYVITPLTSANATTLNTAGSGSTPICTGVTFSANTQTSVAGIACGGSPNTANGATILNLFILNTASATHTFTMGAGSSTEKLGVVGTRPTTISTATVFSQ